MKVLKGKIILFFLCITWFTAISQTYILNATVKGFSQKTVYLANYFGYKNTVIDSASADNNGTFQFKLKDNYKNGLYKIILEKSQKSETYSNNETSINIIYNKESIEFATYFTSLIDSMKIILSHENKIYYEFKQKENKINTQLEILSQLPLYFPKEDEFYPEIKKRYNDIQEQYQNYISEIKKKTTSSFAAHIIKSTHYPLLDFNLSGEAKQQYILQHFLDNIDFTDTLLLYSDLFTSKAIAYIKLYGKQGLTKEQQEQGFIIAVDTLMRKSRLNDRINTQIKDYLIEGFELLDMDKVLEYISEHYMVENSCNDDKHSSMLKKRLEGYKKLLIGTKAPEVMFADEKNKPFKLSELKSPYTLLIFWASWCPHCQEAMPELKKIVEQQKEKRLEVVAISIDTNKTEYYNAIQKVNYHWINYCDTNGWNGKAANDYYLYATPTMFLLDKEKKIIAKPTTLGELKEQLQLVGLISN
jgi:thiol-disulfide isomerase/thioredoxin